MISNIVTTLSVARGINIEYQKDFIINCVKEVLKTTMPNEDDYKKKIKELKLKKTREKELKELDDDNDDNHSISSEEEIVVKKVVKKKVPKKKKVIYIDENEDDESTNDRSVIIVNKMPAPTINQHPPAPKPRPKAIFL